MTEKFKKIIMNTLKFSFMMIFILKFIDIFGDKNTLAGVAIYVGFATFPYCNTGLSRKSESLLITLLYMTAPAVAYLNRYSLISIPINFIYIYILMIFTIEPAIYRLHIIYLLPFLFCESVPVSFSELPMRILSFASGIAVILIYSNYKWKKLSINNGAITIKTQMMSGFKHHSTAVRMATGLTLALFAASFFKAEKSLWISLVVMSLTQIESSDMILRIKERTLGTLVGIIFVSVFFGYIIPQQYQIAVVLFFGFLGFFYNDYRHKQFFNFVSSISASLMIFDQNTAMLNRFISLCIGIIIVLTLYFIEQKFISAAEAEA